MKTGWAVLLLASAAAAEPASEYTITTTIRLVQPYDLRAMNDDFQEARLLDEAGGVGTFEITYYPLREQSIGANPDWRRDSASMLEYLKPYPAANWDPQLQARILTDLQSDGIEPEGLDDRSLVQKVSRWAMQRSSFNSQFGLWMVEFDQNGRASVAPGLEDAFRRNEPGDLEQEALLERELYGKGMYQNKTHGACTSTASYLTTILRALGIPTRIIVTVPAADGNDPAQCKMLAEAIHHFRTRKLVSQGLATPGFSNHIFNEVWVGGRWVRLNYARLGQGIVDNSYEGLMTHIYTARDLSEIPFAATWGARFGTGAGPKLSSSNPYQLLSARDTLPKGVENPPVERLTQATVVAFLATTDPSIPIKVPAAKEGEYVLCIREWLSSDDYHQLRDFVAEASSKFSLSAPNQPELEVELSGGTMSSGDGKFQAYGARVKGQPAGSVTYRLIPHNQNQAHHWKVLESLRVTFPQ